MKHSLVALAVATAATAASAQSSVTVFGVVDLGVTRGSSSGNGSTGLTHMSTGANSTSKLGFRGTEDLGGGLTASFWLEGQLYADTGTAGRPVPAGNQSITTPQGTGMSFTRRSTVSLAGKFGEVRLGRDFTPSLYNLSNMDPWANVGVATSIVVVGASNGLNAGPTFSLVPAGQGTHGPLTRASNEVSYFLPKLGGLFGQVSYWMGENVKNGAINEDDGTGAGIRLGYERGPFLVQAGYGKTRYRGTPVATTAGAQSGDFQSWNVGGSWDFGVAKVMAVFSREERQSVSPAKGQGWLVGTRVPLGVGELRASFGQYEVDAGAATVDPRTRQMSVGYVYNLSKRTALYSTASRVRNSNGARIALGGSTIGAGVGNARSTGFDLGLRHSF
jgi:predicted porin